MGNKSCEKVNNREFILSLWKERAKRQGEKAILSLRYKGSNHDLEAKSKQFAEMIMDYVKPYIKGKRVLEIGCGIGRFTHLLAQQAKHVYAIDSCNIMLERAKRKCLKYNNVSFQECFVQDLDPTPKYDCAFICMTLIHLLCHDDVLKAIQTIKSVCPIVIICEHTDEDMQNSVSALTRLWPYKLYEKAFADSSDEFEEIKKNENISYFGDKVTFAVFRRKNDTVIGEPDYNPQSWSEKHLDSAIKKSSIKTVTPYHRLIGDSNTGKFEYVQADIEIIVNNERHILPPELNSSVDGGRTEILEEVKYNGRFIDDELKARISDIVLCPKDTFGETSNNMSITLNPVSYYDYLIEKKALQSFEYKNKHTIPKCRLYEIKKMQTTNVGGCGIFLITNDGYIILSKRSNLVEEYPSIISYSASGSISWEHDDNDEIVSHPFRTIIEETFDEIGVGVDDEEVKMFSVGIDQNAYFIQFGFFAYVNHSALEVVLEWQKASSNYEQTPIFIKFEPEQIAQVLNSYVFEPSAEEDLILLCSKAFAKEKRGLERSEQNDEQLNSMSEESLSTDVAIITATDIEEIYVKKLSRWTEKKFDHDSTYFYFANVYSEEGEMIRIVTARQNQMGMTAAAALTMKMIYHFRPKIIITVGIAAGIKGRVKFGDIIIPSEVWDYSSGKHVEENYQGIKKVVFQPDSRQYSLDVNVFANASKDYGQILMQIKDNWLKYEKSVAFAKMEIKIHCSPMACGPSVVQTEEIIKELILPHKRKTIAIDMESYAVFYAAINAHSPKPIPICIKSISDFANHQKNDKYQRIAAFNSSQFMLHWITHGLYEVILKKDSVQ